MYPTHRLILKWNSNNSDDSDDIIREDIISDDKDNSLDNSSIDIVLSDTSSNSTISNISNKSNKSNISNKSNKSKELLKINKPDKVPVTTKRIYSL